MRCPSDLKNPFQDKKISEKMLKISICFEIACSIYGIWFSNGYFVKLVPLTAVFGSRIFY